MRQFAVEQLARNKFVIVIQGYGPLPAIFDERAKAQTVADRLNKRESTPPRPWSPDLDRVQTSLRERYRTLTKPGAPDGPPCTPLQQGP